MLNLNLRNHCNMTLHIFVKDSEGYKFSMIILDTRGLLTLHKHTHTHKLKECLTYMFILYGSVILLNGNGK